MRARDWAFLGLFSAAIACTEVAYADEKAETELFFKNQKTELALHAKFLSAKHNAAAESYKIGALLSACGEGHLAKAMFAKAVNKADEASEKLRVQLEASADKPNRFEIARATASSSGSMASYTLGAGDVGAIIAGGDQGLAFCSRVIQFANKLLAGG